MNTYKLKIQYKGTRYSGWQKQPDEKTIQGELNKALFKISKTEDLKTLGSGRTDSGVHALGQVVKLTMPLDIGGPELTRGLNSLLPEDIQVIEVDKCSEDFHPIQNAQWKEYIYLFSTSRNLSLFHKEYVAIHPYELNLDLMKEACSLFKGRHDFSDFQCVGTEVNSTVREIFDCEITNYKDQWGIFPETDDVLMLRVVGEGFLKQMVRLMVGTLWSIGQSKSTLDELKSSLDHPLDRRLGVVAPPQGLYLKEVFYPSK